VAPVALEVCGGVFLSGEGVFFATTFVFRGNVTDVVDLTDPVEDRRFSAASFFSGSGGGKGGGLLAAGLGEGAADREVAVLTLTLETVDAADARLDREDVWVGRSDALALVLAEVFLEDTPASLARDTGRSALVRVLEEVAAPGGGRSVMEVLAVTGRIVDA
jgi:hypothetical protein